VSIDVMFMGIGWRPETVGGRRKAEDRRKTVKI
jgi:hypothetical protein